MKKYLLNFICCIALTSTVQSCKSFSHLYLEKDKNRAFFGKLKSNDYDSLQRLLNPFNNLQLSDTIIINYNYNYEHCWDNLENREDEHIVGFVTRHNEKIKKLASERPNVKVFNFRESGNNVNKIIKWNPLIIIDSSKQLFNLLFTERCTCGSSIIIMPDKKFIFLRSDPHYEILDLQQSKMEEMMRQ
jgi:hypothetical protein